jgi:hypothetical protein
MHCPSLVSWQDQLKPHALPQLSNLAGSPIAKKWHVASRVPAKEVFQQQKVLMQDTAIHGPQRATYAQARSREQSTNTQNTLCRGV